MACGKAIFASLIGAIGNRKGRKEFELHFNCDLAYELS